MVFFLSSFFASLRRAEAESSAEADHAFQGGTSRVLGVIHHTTHLQSLGSIGHLLDVVSRKLEMAYARYFSWKSTINCWLYTNCGISASNYSVIFA